MLRKVLPCFNAQIFFLVFFLVKFLFYVTRDFETVLQRCQSFTRNPVAAPSAGMKAAPELSAAVLTV